MIFLITTLVLSVGLFCVFYSLALSLVSSTQANSLVDRQESRGFHEGDGDLSLKCQGHAHSDRQPVKSKSSVPSDNQSFSAFGGIKRQTLLRRHSEPWDPQSAKKTEVPELRQGHMPDRSLRAETNTTIRTRTKEDNGWGCAVVRCQTVLADSVSRQDSVPEPQRSSSLQLQQTSGSHDAYATSTGFYCSQPEIKEDGRNYRADVSVETITNETVKVHRKESGSDDLRSIEACTTVSEDLERENTVYYDSQADDDEKEEWEDKSTDILADSEHLVENTEVLSLGGLGQLGGMSPFKDLQRFSFPLKFNTIKTCAVNNRSMRTLEEMDRSIATRTPLPSVHLYFDQQEGIRKRSDCLCDLKYGQS